MLASFFFAAVFYVVGGFFIFPRPGMPTLLIGFPCLILGAVVFFTDAGGFWPLGLLFVFIGLVVSFMGGIFAIVDGGPLDLPDSK